MTALRRYVRPVVMCVAVLLSGAGVAHGQALDHLKCHKVKDPLHLPRTTADLPTDLQPEFAASGCQILKPKFFCVPVAKQNVVPAPPRPDIVGQDLSNDFICYKIKCPTQPGDHQVTDQFGTRTQTKFKTSMLCVPAVKGAAPTTTSTTTTGTTTSSTTTTVPPTSCCGAEEIVLQSMSGAVIKTSTLGPSSVPTFTLTLDSGISSAFPGCQHALTVPAGGLGSPGICLNGLNFTGTVEALGCLSGGTDGGGSLWDGGAACPAANVSKVADTSDGVCNPPGQPCNTTGSGSGNNTLGNVDATRGGAPCGGGGVHALVDIPIRHTWWLDADGDCPDLDNTYDPGTDTLVLQFDQIMSLVTGNANADFVDQNGDSCSFAGQGPDHTKHCSGNPARLCSSNVHCTSPLPNEGTCVDGPLTGAPATGPCCRVGQTMTLVGSAPSFTGSPPLFDILFDVRWPMQVIACNPSPGPATCTLPNSCMD
jgi:hypothetical protein